MKTTEKKSHKKCDHPGAQQVRMRVMLTTGVSVCRVYLDLLFVATYKAATWLIRARHFRVNSLESFFSINIRKLTYFSFVYPPPKKKTHVVNSGFCEHVLTTDHLPGTHKDLISRNHPRWGLGRL